METRIDKIYKYERKIENLKAGLKKFEINKKANYEKEKIDKNRLEIHIKLYEEQLKMIKKHLEDNPSLKGEIK